ncbi:DDE-type integrase/transposase/recombinase, partial [Aduncisulcus paluster]
EHPSHDGEFILRTDASTTGIGGILLQRDSTGKEKLINLFSKKFSTTESRWSTIEQEAFGVYYGITSNNFYLLGKKFRVETDHRNLKYIYKSEVPKLVRWRMMLAPYTFLIEHIPGKTNETADFLSRITSVSKKNPVIASITSPPISKEQSLLLQKVHIELGHASERLM